MTEANGPLSFLLSDEHREVYPRELVARFPHVARRLEELWNDADALADCFSDLMVPRRPNRQGFPAEVASEIFALSMAYDRIGPIRPGLPNNGPPGEVNPYHWERERAIRELDRLGIPLTMAGFTRAAEAGDRRICGLFVSAGFDIDARDARHWTPLMMAAFNGHETLALELIHHGADIEACDHAGYAPMHWAAYNGYRQVTKLLLTKGAAADVSSNAGITPLLQAAARGHVDTIALLLEHGADPNATARDGSTPLLKAVANGRLPVVRQLLEAGASTEATMKDGTTLREIARRAKDPRVGALIGAVSRTRP